jgi:hypothetical protein
MKSFYEWMKIQKEALMSVGGPDMTHGWELPPYHRDKTIGGASGQKAYEKHKRYYEKGIKTVVIPELSRILARSDEFPLHIYFGEKNDLGSISYFQLGKFISLGDKRNTSYKDYFFKELGIPSDHIVYVKSQSGGDIWKPWMILHGLGHAIDDADSVIPIQKVISDFYLKNTVVSLNAILSIPAFKKVFLSPIFTFNSAQVSERYLSSFSKTDNETELVYELFPWFFYNGCKIPFPKNDMIYEKMLEEIEKMKQGVPNFNPPSSAMELKKRVEDMLVALEREIRNSLDDVRGRVIFD